MTRYRVTIRGPETELRGYASPDALAALADDIRDPSYVVVALLAEDDYDPFDSEGQPSMSVRSKLRWWLLARRCTCGEQRLLGSTVELAGVKHRLDGPCYLCDEYGEPRCAY